MILFIRRGIRVATLLYIIPMVAFGSEATVAPDHRTSQLPLTWRREPGVVALLQDSRIVWQFNFAATEAKPYFHPVALQDGPVLTLAQPADHRWHHGLWFSWKLINGVNYWEEDPVTGLSQGRTTWQEPTIELRADFSARIVMELNYRPAFNAQPVLYERRLIDITPPSADGAYRQDWELAFTAADADVVLDRTPLLGEPGGKSWGGYAGLSVRLSPDLLDPKVTTTLGPVEFSDGRYRGRATAMDYSGSFERRQAGIAILDWPANPGTPSPWYAINEGAARYFSPAFLCYQPHVIKARQQLLLHYRVIAHPGLWSEEQLREASGHYGARVVHFRDPHFLNARRPFSP